MKTIRTLFINSTFHSKSFLSGKRFVVDGVQTANNIQAAIDEMEIDGYEFINSENYTSSQHSYSFTEGTLLYFRKIKSPS